MAVPLTAVFSAVFFAFPTFFVLFWLLTRTYAYLFIMDAEWHKRDFQNVVLPDDVGQEVKDTFFGVIDLFFDPKNLKFYTIRIHITLSAVMGLICVIQLVPFLRYRFMKLHRTLGYLYCALLVPFSLEMVMTLLVVGMAPMGWAVAWGNTVSLVSMVGGTVVGVRAAKRHNVRLHRAGMIINAAGLFTNPAQRFFWALVSKNNVWGPYVTYKAWVDNTLTTTEAMAVSACFLTAAMYITVITPSTGFKGGKGVASVGVDKAKVKAT